MWWYWCRCPRSWYLQSSSMDRKQESWWNSITTSIMVTKVSFFFLFFWWVLSIRKYWDSINLLLVGFGQQICSSPSPKCQDCLLNKLCPSASRSAKRTRIDKKRKDTKESESSEDIEDLVLESDSEDSEELDNFSKHIDKLKRSKWSRLRADICIANKMLFENEFSHFYILFI